MFENQLPNKIIARVMDHSGKEVNVSKLADCIKIPTPSVWNKVAGNRKWDADTWLKTLWALGYARYTVTLNGGHISIKVPLDENEIAKLNKTVSRDVFLSDN